MFVSPGAARAAALCLIIPAALIGGCSKIRNEGETKSSSKAATVDKPAELEFYVMSQCPYGVQVVDAIAPVLKELGPNVNFKMGYIGTAAGGNFNSLHGEPEVKGNIAQLCAMQQSPDKYMDMVVCQNKDMRAVDKNWETCGKEAGLDVAKLKSCFEGEEGKKLLTASFEESAKKGAEGSPTIFLNGKPYEGGRKTADFMRAVCGEYGDKKPTACSSIPEPPKVAAIFFTDARCAECDIAPLEERLKGVVGGLQVKKVDYSSEEGKALYAELAKEGAGFKYLPAILFDESIDKDTEGKQQLGRWLSPVGKYQALALGGKFDPTAEICDNGGTDDDADGKADCADDQCTESMSCRPEKKKVLDMFVMSQCPYGAKAMIGAHEFAAAFGKDVQLNVHFIGDEQGGQLTAMHGQTEVDENIRELCAAKHYAKDHKYLEYLACRSKDYRNNEWKSCAVNGIKADVIEKCQAGEGKELLRKDYGIAKALNIGASPTFLVNNRTTFNAIDANGIKTEYCKANPGLAGCEKTLSGAVAEDHTGHNHAPGEGHAPAGGACQ